MSAKIEYAWSGSTVYAGSGSTVHAESGSKRRDVDPETEFVVWKW